MTKTSTVEKTWLQQIRYRVRPKPYGGWTSTRRDEDTDVYLVGTARKCQCFEDAPVHRLRMIKEPESLRPVCGAGRERWCFYNQEGELDDVTCESCVATILKNMTETEKKRWRIR